MTQERNSNRRRKTDTKKEVKKAELSVELVYRERIARGGSEKSEGEREGIM